MESEALDTVPPPRVSAPATPPPAGACDVHAHAFGPYERFPLRHRPSYPPPLSPAATHRAMLDTVGLARGVLVQPAPYGEDTSALCDALSAGAGRLRGVAVASPGASDATLEALAGAGVTGLRFVDKLDPSGAPYAGSVGTGALAQLGPRMASLGWHAEVWGDLAKNLAVVERFGEVGPAIVLDHLGGVSAARDDGLERERLLALVREGRVWVKLTLCRASQDRPGYGDLRRFHDALVEANPGRLLWGSDFPFVRMGADAPDVGRLMDLFMTWVDDPGLQRRILCDNPATLYGFPSLAAPRDGGSHDHQPG